MAKLSLADLSSLQNEQTAINTINNNSSLIEVAMEKTLSRDGSTPNAMLADLDMNSHQILNLPFPTSPTEPIRFGDVDNLIPIWYVQSTAPDPDETLEYSIWVDSDSEDKDVYQLINGAWIDTGVDIKGEKGSTGDPGEDGEDGPPNTLTIGTVTSGPANATITGTSPNQVLNLVLQTGSTGATGPTGPAVEVFVQNSTPSTSGVPEDSLWIDADSPDNDLYQLQSGSWVDTGVNLKGASGSGTGDVVGPSSATADSLARYSGTSGKLIKDGAVIGVDVQTQRTITGTSNEIAVSNGDGVSGNPTLSIPSTFTLTGKTVTVTTQSQGDNSTKAASTAYVDTRILKGYLHGLTLSNNTSDATNDIDIAAGEAASIDSSPYRMVLASALTKRLDASWAVGTGNGGLDTGTIANTTYHIWLIQRSDTGVVDALFSTSASSPTMPANYDRKRRIGSIVRVSNAIKGFVQDGDSFRYLSPAADVAATNPGTSAVTRTLTVPIGIRVQALIGVALFSTTNSTDTMGAVYISDLSLADISPDKGIGFSVEAYTSATGTDINAAESQCFTNTSGQVRSRLQLSGVGSLLYINTHGYIDTRGRLA